LKGKRKADVWKKKSREQFTDHLHREKKTRSSHAVARRRLPERKAEARNKGTTKRAIPSKLGGRGDRRATSNRQGTKSCQKKKDKKKGPEALKATSSQ